MRFRNLLTAALLAAFTSTAAVAQQPRHLFFRVTAGPAVHAPISGRLLVFIRRGTGAKHISINEFDPNATWVAAREVHDLAPGAAIDIDTDQIAYPRPFSSLAPGDYQVQAVLDVHHTYNYSALTPGDLISPVLTLTQWTPGQGPEPELALDTTVPPRTPRKLTPAQQTALTHMRLAEDQSALLTQFWGRPIYIRAWVVLPPGYHKHPKRR